MNVLRRNFSFSAAFGLLALIVLANGTAQAEDLGAVPTGHLLRDGRRGPLVDLNGYFPFKPPASEREWTIRSARFRKKTLISLGLFPLPVRHDLKAVVHGKIEMEDYTVERAYFESLPGFFVSGSLYRPKGRAPKNGRPGILCPHGHWSNGRFYDNGEANAKKQISDGAEETISGGRSPLQARCVHLARMGCVVLHYDMIGYADSQQISRGVAHGFAKQRDHLKSPKRYGLFSPQAESQLQSVMGLQAYSTIRALDFLESLDDVDAKRLAVTGASGGGTQTFIIGAIDPRPVAAVPAVMVSTAMQGGCTCENCSLLRVDEGNIAFAALFAPKPLGLTAANDWTKEMSTKGFPELKKLYGMLGAEDSISLLDRTDFGHNYNSVSRHFMYNWFNKHLQLGVAEPIRERDFSRLSTEQMTVWDDAHPRPPSGEDFEVALLKHLSDDFRGQIDAVRPKDAESAQAYRRVVGEGIDAVIGRGLPKAKHLDFEQTVKNEREKHLAICGLIENKTAQEQIPIAFLFPKNWKDHVVIWLTKRGKSGLLSEQGSPSEQVKRLLDAGVAVVGVDLFEQGEAMTGDPVKRTRRVKNKREAAAYTFGYNRSLFARRVHDILTAVSFVRNHEYRPAVVDVLALDDEVGPLAAAARAQARSAVSHAAIDTHGFRFIEVSDLHHPQFLPGGAKYDDLPGMLAVAAPAPLWLSGESKSSASIVDDAYQATQGGVVWAGEKKTTRSAVDWLLNQEE